MTLLSYLLYFAALVGLAWMLAIWMAVLAFLSMPLGILVGGAVAATVPAALAAVQEPGPHGMSEILYAYSSATGNNGSAFGG